MISPTADRQPNRKRGFTLLELLLVLAILAIMASIAVPTFESMISSRRIQQSIERLQNELLEARVEAMKTGQAQVFRATIHGDSYSISPWLSGDEASDASAGATVMTAGGVMETERTETGAVASTASSAGGLDSESVKQLDTDVMFYAVETLVDARNALEIQQSGEIAPLPGVATAPTSGSMSSPLLLYPDGTSTTAQIILADVHGRRMAIQLRGVTGRSTNMRLSAVDASTLPSIISSATKNP
ncbi:MAG: prepilin-type N-terminal cleavage/methylation domain-containing protein [Pirellula sp.]|jgi:type II secretion system protein H|nr:prepilin-type N-terminal cleavage/methylation domain-containing protein [Pirellula sp.]